MTSPGGRADEGRVLTGRRPVLELLRAGGGAERILLVQGADSAPIVRDIRRQAERAAIPVRVVPRAEVDNLAQGTNHQGVVALTARYRYMPLEEMLERSPSALLFADGVMDPHNLGSLLRTANVAGFDGVVIPARRAAGVTAAVRRVAAGAAESLAVARVGALAHAIQQAQEAGLWIVGLEERAEEEVWSSHLLDGPVGLVLGSEDKGLSKAVRDRCDGLVGIPGARRIGSLNVAVAGAVAMFEVARRRHETSAS